MQVDDAADLGLALGAIDFLQLARGTQRIDPGPQILLRRIGRGLGGALGSLSYRLH